MSISPKLRALITAPKERRMIELLYDEAEDMRERAKAMRAEAGRLDEIATMLFTDAEKREKALVPHPA